MSTNCLSTSTQINMFYLYHIKKMTIIIYWYFNSKTDQYVLSVSIHQYQNTNDFYYSLIFYFKNVYQSLLNVNTDRYVLFVHSFSLIKHSFFSVINTDLLSFKVGSAAMSPTVQNNNCLIFKFSRDKNKNMEIIN